MSYDFKLSNGDVVLTSTGAFQQVFNEEKLIQDIVKVILTPQGSYQLYPWYGSPLGDRVVGKLLDAKLLDMEVANAILYSLNTLKELQLAQEQDGQYLSPTEVISQINDVRVEPNIYDGRAFSIVVSVTTRRGNVVEETFTITT